MAPARPARPKRAPADRRQEVRQSSSLKAYGERPPGFFAPVPVSEVAILVGGIGALVGVASGEGSALIVGVVVCTLGVLEVTAREHFSGFRSHATLLAAAPPVAILAVAVALLGSPNHRSTRELLVAGVVPVFGVLFWWLRKRFWAARQARVVRPRL